jgi:hypothetical protein
MVIFNISITVPQHSSRQKVFDHCDINPQEGLFVII